MERLRRIRKRSEQPGGLHTTREFKNKFSPPKKKSKPRHQSPIAKISRSLFKQAQAGDLQRQSIYARIVDSKCEERRMEERQRSTKRGHKMCLDRLNQYSLERSAKRKVAQ